MSGSWPERIKDRLGERGLALAILAGLLVLGVVPLVALPAARCHVFGDGCTAKLQPPKPADPVAAHGSKALTPAEAATHGSYVALGDSYSAGVGANLSPADLNPLNRCHRSGKAYYYDVAKAFKFGKGTSFWACSGATTGNLENGQSGEPSQIGRVDQNTSLVTLSIGGNDVGFARVLANCVIKLPWSNKCEGQGGEIADRMAKLRQSLPDVLQKINERAPAARVIVLGYPRGFSEASGSNGDNLSVHDQQWLNGRARDLNELIRQVASEADRRIAATEGQGSVEFIDAYSAFAGHEVGSPVPYINGLSVDLGALKSEARSFHPTDAGYQALAKLFIDQVNKGPGRQLNQFR
ncbi:SGNH/GDSL hydrolase family protein [Actinomadura barringtoniae]|uniref:SGNH/GDSL hydrolase family protein n=1 Tax=Actinomadura barringtoniae TaxID=1427535 RepID=A0A939PH67_9ACTN|nr:SGNH/GDSL hydrolase family protein [Actinomadura barringtoniae]MBO2449699.1 SGNH/GDSL hydrolase family protein [Actinomadura barringtoniae]